MRLLIVDDHRLFRQGLAGLLQSEPEFEIVGEAASGEEALRLAGTTAPEIALVDLKMPDMPGTDVIAELRTRWPALGVVVLTASDDDGELIRAIQAGAQGYVLKSADAESLFDVIRQVHAGGAGLCQVVTPKVLEILRSLTMRPAPSVPLTPREEEVLALVIKGADNAEIASRLVISENTVKSHVSHILEKLDAIPFR
jgi:DNA-binding NarL/FixJ family response regulator